MADRRLTMRIPIWVRVSGIITLVLVGVVVSSMLLGASGSGSHEGSRDRGGQMEGMGGTVHNGGQTGTVAPFESNPAPSCDQTPPKEGGPSDTPDDPTPTPGPGDHTRSDGRRGH